MKKTCLIVFAIAGLSFAGVKTYTVRISEPSLIGSTLLKPGRYEVRVEGAKAVFATGNHKAVAETGVQVQTTAKRFDSTAVIATTEGKAQRIERIELGGSRLALQLN